MLPYKFKMSKSKIQLYEKLVDILKEKFKNNMTNSFIDNLLLDSYVFALEKTYSTGKNFDLMKFVISTTNEDYKKFLNSISNVEIEYSYKRKLKTKSRKTITKSKNKTNK